MFPMAVRCWGNDVSSPGLMSSIRRVPAAVPLVRHSSNPGPGPWLAARNIAKPPTVVISAGWAGSSAGSTTPVPASVPLLL